MMTWENLPPLAEIEEKGLLAPPLLAEAKWLLTQHDNQQAGREMSEELYAALASLDVLCRFNHRRAPMH